MSRRQLNPPQSPGEGLQFMNFAHCLHVVLIISKYTDVFREYFFSGVCVGGGVIFRHYLKTQREIK